MNPHPLFQPGRLKSLEIMNRTRQMVHDRTLELALLDGRSNPQMKQADYERAKRELTGESDFARQQEIFDFPEY